MIRKSNGEPPAAANDEAPDLRPGWNRHWQAAGLVLLVTAMPVVLACWPEPQVETTPKKLAMGWRPILSQSGRGTVQTESFQIDTGQWRIKWSAAAEADTKPVPSEFRIGVHSAVSGRLMNLAIEHPGAGEGIAYVAEEPRPFFLSIESSGLNWSVQVEEGILGEPERNAPYPASR